jgi:hypothetical protein
MYRPMNGPAGTETMNAVDRRACNVEVVRDRGIHRPTHQKVAVFETVLQITAAHTDQP